jgi:hypothetical protein
LHISKRILTFVLNQNQTAMKKSDLNLAVIQNFILHITHASEDDNVSDEPMTFTANELYQMAVDYIEEDHVDGKDNPEDDIEKFWVESSFDFEDKEKAYPEAIIVAVDKGEEGTETIATFTDVESRKNLELLINRFNNR